MKILAIILALLIAGCSKQAQKQSPSDGHRAVSDEELAATKLKGEMTDAQLRQAGFSDKDIEVFRNMQGKSWRKHFMVDPMDGHRSGTFTLFAQPIYEGWQSKRDIGVRVMIPCEKGIDVMVQTNDAPEKHVRLRFDDGPVQSEEWGGIGKSLLEQHSKEFLSHLLAAKTMKFEYSPKDSVPQAYELSVMNLKELMAQEPACKFLMP
ncbi:MAG TPA: hypothetical protein VFW31_09490 [Candidatus Angelobacter sp.]|nr:hypothetical protein [Candidatus Angelobacter sp.]